VYARADVEAAGSAIHVPRVEMSSRAKLSCVAWNGYIKGALLAADYDGGVALWDAETAACTAMFEEHGKRVWSVDFSQVAARARLRRGPGASDTPCGPAVCPLRARLYALARGREHGCARVEACGQRARQGRPPAGESVSPEHAAGAQADPTRFLSGSDDCTVRLWSLHDPAAAAVIDAKANVCSVQFSPASSHLIAFGSANFRVYIYDLRTLKARAPPARAPPAALCLRRSRQRRVKRLCQPAGRAHCNPTHADLVCGW
jgi:WD40 repeat protein